MGHLRIFSQVSSDPDVNRTMNLVLVLTCHLWTKCGCVNDSIRISSVLLPIKIKR